MSVLSWNTDDTDRADDHRFFIVLKINSYLRTSVLSVSSVFHDNIDIAFEREMYTKKFTKRKKRTTFAALL